jgi:hypothetical protein
MIDCAMPAVMILASTVLGATIAAELLITLALFYLAIGDVMLEGHV